MTKAERDAYRAASSVKGGFTCRLIDHLEAALEALPAPVKLDDLADWLDIIDGERGSSGDEVQRDLRLWAEQARAVLGEKGA
jgi:hypothetical protein